MKTQQIVLKFNKSNVLELSSQHMTQINGGTNGVISGGCVPPGFPGGEPPFPFPLPNVPDFE